MDRLGRPAVGKAKMAEVTLVMPHRDTADWLRLSAAMWLAQDAEPLLLVVDTGSRGEASHAALEEVARHPRAEVAHLKPKWQTPHVWDMISAAHDYGLSRCQTEFIMTTHTDVFPRHRGVVAFMRGLCGADAPVAGWEMSRRGHNLNAPQGPWVSDGCVGTACTIFHVPTLDRIGAGWSIRRSHHAFGTSRKPDSPGWPDNETLMGHLLRQSATPIRFLGRETNFENQETEHWLHARSMTVHTVLDRGLEPRHHEALARMRALFATW